MTHKDYFMIGATLETMESLESMGLTDPDAGYRPFSVADSLGDGSTEGNGFAVATWHFTGLEPGLADVLQAFIGDNLSAFVYFRTRLNRLNASATDYEWMSFGGWMRWTEGEEDVPALHELDLNITFTGLVPYPDYPTEYP